MNKENKIRKILKDSNLDGTKASMCVEKQELDEEIVQNCLKKELYDARSIIKEKTMVAKRHIIDRLSSKSKDIVDDDEYEDFLLNNSYGYLLFDTQKMERLLDAYLKQTGDFGESIDAALLIAISHVKESVTMPTRLVYEKLGVFVELFIYVITDLMDVAKDKQFEELCVRICRDIAVEKEQELTKFLWDKDFVAKCQGIFEMVSVGNVLAYIASVKDRYEDEITSIQDNIECEYSENPDGTYTARCSEASIVVHGNTEEEAFRRLVEMYKMRDETAIGIWEKINNEYDDTVDYRLMFRRRE